MSWTVRYSYGSICDSQTLDTEDEADAFYYMIEERIVEMGEEGEYDSNVEMEEDEE